MCGEEASRLADDGSPSGSAICAAVQSGGCVGDSYVNRLLLGMLADGLEDNEDHPNSAGGSSDGEGGGLVPGGAEVRALPQAIVTRSKIQDVVMLWVYGKTFPGIASGFVGAELDWQIDA